MDFFHLSTFARAQQENLNPNQPVANRRKQKAASLKPIAANRQAFSF